MKQLFKIHANITLINKGGRTLPIKSGYRPGFSFIEKKQTSGSITLLNQDFLSVGESTDVEILFFSDLLLGNINEKTTFNFFEGGLLVGFGNVITIDGWVDNQLS